MTRFCKKKAKTELAREKRLIELSKTALEKNLSEQDVQKEREIIVQEYHLELTHEDLAILEILEAKKTVKVHVHKEDDVLYLIWLTKKYGLKVTADHTGDVFHTEIFDLLAENGIPVVYGPIGSLGYKVELKHAFYENCQLLMQSKAEFGLMTDHPVIHSYSLRDSLKFFLIQGMREEDAISLITYKNAKILGIDDVLGTVEKGKMASMVVWDKPPLSLSAFPIMIMAEGRIIRTR